MATVCQSQCKRCGFYKSIPGKGGVAFFFFGISPSEGHVVYNLSVLKETDMTSLPFSPSPCAHQF